MAEGREARPRPDDLIRGAMTNDPDSTPLLHRLARFSVERARWVAGLWVLAAAALAPAIVGIKIETSADSVLDRLGDPWDFYQSSLRTFGGDETVVVAIRGAEPYSPSDLDRMRDLSEAASRIDGVRRVDSLSTVPYLDARIDGSLSLEPFLSTDGPTTSASASAVAARVRRDRIAPRALASEDGRVLAVNATLDRGTGEFERIVGELRGAAGTAATWISGVPVFRTAFSVETRAEVLRLVPLTIALMAALLGALFRSIRAVAVPLLTSGLGTWVFLGAMAMAGAPLTASTVILPSVILAIGCAYAMHLLSEASGLASRHDLVEAVAEVARPLLFAGSTTAVGFAAMAVVPIDAVRDVGIFGGVGTFAVLVAVLTLGPAVLVLWPRPTPKPLLLDWLQSALVPAIASLVQRRRSAVLGAWAVVIAGFALGLSVLRVESDVILYFPRGTEVRDSYEAIRERLAGISPMNVVIESSAGRSVTEPDVLRAVAGLQEFLQTVPDVGKVVSLADPLIQVHTGFAGTTTSVLPDSRELAEQYLLLLESFDQIRDLVSSDRLMTNVLIRSNHNGSEHLLALAERAAGWWRMHGPEDFSARTTGIMFEFARSEHELGVGQIQGLGLDVATVAMLLLVLFRSLRIAGLALIPNLVPLVLVFGFMGLAGIPLDIGTVLVGNLAVGIAVDETIHVVNAFRSGVARGEEAGAAMREALARVLPALLYTTLTVAAGFLVLGISEFTFTRNLGLLTAGIMVICVVANATLLPALLIGTGARGRGPGARGRRIG
jgi:hypothetical protein